MPDQLTSRTIYSYPGRMSEIQMPISSKKVSKREIGMLRFKSRLYPLETVPEWGKLSEIAKEYNAGTEVYLRERSDGPDPTRINGTYVDIIEGFFRSRRYGTVTFQMEKCVNVIHFCIARQPRMIELLPKNDHYDNGWHRVTGILSIREPWERGDSGWRTSYKRLIKLYKENPKLLVEELERRIDKMLDTIMQENDIMGEPIFPEITDEEEKERR